MFGNIVPSLSQPSSSTFSNTLVLRPTKGEATRVDMQISDIIDLEIRDKVAAMLPSYPSYSLLYLTYVLLTSNGKPDAARDLLHDTRHNRDQHLPIAYIINLKEIGDVTMREKVEGVIKMVPEVTIWWAFYALQVCDGCFDHAIGLLFEGVVDASKDPAIQVALASTARVSPAISPMSRPDESLIIDSSSDSDSSFFSDTNGNESSKPTLSSPELLHPTPSNFFVDSSDDDYISVLKPRIDKGKGVNKSDPEDLSSDIEMSNIPPFKESPRVKRHEEANRTCKFCGTLLKDWLARTSHEKSCRMKTKLICVKCKREVLKSNIRRHEASCDSRQTSRHDGPEYEVRGSTRVTASRDSSPDFDSSDSHTEDQLQKVKEMQLLLPRLSFDKCIESLALCDYNVKEAINLERETLTSDEEVDERGSYRRKNDSGKRGSGSTSVG